VLRQGRQSSNGMCAILARHFVVDVQSAKAAESRPMKTPILESLIVVLIVCLGWLKTAQAVSPPPDGGYPNFTTAEGQNALHSLTTGAANTALGAFSLFANTTGSFNTAVGALALDLNTGDQNTAVGVAALLPNTGTQNTAIGTAALEFNDSGFQNTATGAFALSANTTGVLNTANGAFSLFSNTTGNSNTVVGHSALHGNTTGTNNVALGFAAGFNHITGDNNVYIANEGVDGENSTIRIGSGLTHTKFLVVAVRGVTTGNNDAVNVVIDSAGQLGTMSSSRRFKKEIKPMDNASEAILALKPVTFRYKNDKTNRPEFGLIAEEVAEVNPDLVVRDKDGEIYTVRYDAVNAMLLNEFLKEHRTVQELKSNAAKRDATVAQQQKQIEALTAVVQKVSAQLELNKPAPQTVLNDQ